MKVEIPQSDAAQVLELFILYSKKNAFSIDEYGDVSTMYNKFKEFIVKTQSETSKQHILELEQKELVYLIKVMDVCSQRTPVEVQNYKSISVLFDKLNSMVVVEKEDLPELIEEVKEGDEDVEDVE